MRFLSIPFVKFLLMLAVVAVGIYWLYTTTPPGMLHTDPEEEIMHSCLAEKQRLSGAGFVLHNVEADPADIARFNQMVDDYNRKCGSPNYANFARREVFRGEVQARRDALWAEGIARFPAAARKLTGK